MTLLVTSVCATDGDWQKEAQERTSGKDANVTSPNALKGLPCGVKKAKLVPLQPAGGFKDPISNRVGLSGVVELVCCRPRFAGKSEVVSMPL